MGEDMSTTESEQDLLSQSATFGAMTEATPLDWKIIAAHNRVFANDVAGRVLDHLRLLDGDCGGEVRRIGSCVQRKYVIASIIHSP